jgi:spermidine/putrescine ABC transporter ATP-binding subunit
MKSEASTTVAVRLTDVYKSFGKIKAVEQASFDVYKSEFLTLLGPSGCGKTTTLRIIAGLEEPDNGDVIIGEKRVNGIPPYKRKVSMVFQRHCLWPHMTVEENIAFGLKMKKEEPKRIKDKVAYFLKLVELPGFEDRRVTQLSGGQQQRVALARALAIEPSVLLLDEPLGQLDLKLREQMQIELRKIQKRTGVTTIYVTHDQGEALTMSDRIIVMNFGKIQQLGSPAEIYNKPQNKFVAYFIGKTNMLEGNVELVNSEKLIVRVLGKIIKSEGEVHSPGSCTVALKPERIEIASGYLRKENLFEGTIKDKIFRGNQIVYHIEVDNTILEVVTIFSQESDRYSIGYKVKIGWDAVDCRVISE